MRREGTHYRDKTFDFNRRQVHWSLFSTDLDAVEYFNYEPIDIREYKSKRSGWRIRQNASIVVQATLAQRAGLDYFVIEHDDNWGSVDVYKVKVENKVYVVEKVWEIGLQRYLKWLFEIRGLDYKKEKPNGLPTSFEPITRSAVILRLWNDLTKEEQEELYQTLFESIKWAK